MSQKIELCDKCIHNEVCKYKSKKILANVEEPFSVACAHYREDAPIVIPDYPYPITVPYTQMGDSTSTSICHGCGFYDTHAKKCTIEGKPMGIVGLPCQRVFTWSSGDEPYKTNVTCSSGPMEAQS